MKIPLAWIPTAFLAMAVLRLNNKNHIAASAMMITSPPSSATSTDAVPMWIVFGRPGAGKSTVADAAVASLRDHFEKSATDVHCLALDLDVCIPTWMKDNFAKSIYPTLDQRTTFAHDACDFVAKRVVELVAVKSVTVNENKLSTTDDEDVHHPPCRATRRPLVVVSFSFVNTDLRDMFRSRFPSARWILVDTTEQQAQERIEQRKDHFYKGEKPVEENDTLEKVVDEAKDNSEWKFAPVTFPHVCLDGNDSVEANADKILQDILSKIDSDEGIILS